MTSQLARFAGLVLVCTGLTSMLPMTARAQVFVPTDVGTTVSGYQDDFNGTSLSAGWLVLGANAYAVSNGALHITTTAGDPNHLLYAVAGYNNSVQEVLARIRVLNFGTGDAARGGIAACVDPAASPAGGLDLHFRDENLGRHIEFLDDLRAWGTEYYPSPAWLNNTWYWLRLRHEPNAASQGGANDVFGKIWLADGSQAEPAAWQDVYDYTPARSARTGYAGIVAGSSGGTSELEVDYVLIKASGLPSITVAPVAFVQTPVAISNPPQSQTVVELQPANFSVGVVGSPPPTFQWYRNSNSIPGATNAAYTIASAALGDNGAQFSVVAANVASNTSYSVTSSVATLTVLVDTNGPVLILAQALGLGQVQAVFSERIAPATATNAANYALSSSSGTVAVTNIVLDSSQTNVTLTTGPLSEGVFYTLTVNNLTDQAAAANRIATNSQAGFVAASYSPQDIGSPSPAGGAVALSGGYNVTGGGTDIGGTNDQFQFSYQARSGDFDVKVRIDSLIFSDVWAEAGLMARESLAPGSRFASVMATPTSSGSYFQSRSNTAGPTRLSGSFPVNYPNTWLRLQRVGNQFTGYAGFDGQSWSPLGTVNMALPGNVYFGFAVSSHNTSQTTTAAFRELSVVTSAATNASAPAFEPLGQCNRKTSLVISEIMYHPGNTRGAMNTNAQGFVTNSLEFIELFNSLGTPEDLSGFRLSGDIAYTFPPGTVLAGGAFLVVAKSPADVQSIYGLPGVLGPYTNNLPNSAGTVRLRNRIGAIFLEVNYDSEPPWPAAADGAGHSLVLARPSFGEGDRRAWAASDAVGGSPGRLEPAPSDPLRNVVINEFLAHTDNSDPDFIELFNRGNQPLDLSGCTLSDDPDTNRFVIPPMTILGPRSFISWNQNQLGFALNASGETLYFRNAAGSRVLDAVRYEAQGNGVSFGRYPDGAPALRALTSRTPGTNNTAFRSSDIVINEIMYHPISGDDDDQFIELYNKGTNPVDLAGWKFTAGISFTFASNTVLNPDGYLVVARNAVRLRTNYFNLGSSNLVGDFEGKLAHSGERLALAAPELVIATNSHGVLVTNIIHVVVNEVTYVNGGRWGPVGGGAGWSDGGGSSLELRDPRGDNTLAANWADSDESAKAPWGIFSVTGQLDNGDVAADQLQALLLGPGECLIDDVQVLNASSVNQIANSSFETDASGWTAEGTESNSSLETSGGYNSAKSYHVRALERGDNQVNRVRTPLVAALSANSTATISAKVRWLRGHPEILFRLRGKWLELLCEMKLPTNPGTPGARNSRALTNAPPAISEVAHSPVLPAGNQPCVVTARVSDPDKPVSVALKYRLDPSATYSTTTMLDNGTGGDAVAGDGVYSATIPGQAAGTMVAFYIQATDALNASSTFPNNAPVRECLVRFGEAQPSGNFPVYRIWMTQATLNTWNGRSKLDNTPLDVTFVLGDRRAVYNALALYAGSPYIAPGYSGATSGRCGYTLTFPPDDLFLGSADLVLDWPGGHGGENTAMQEEMGYWIADKLNLPFSHRYIIRLHVNGVTDDQRQAVFEAVIQPSGEFFKAWSPDNSSGDFYKIDRGFEFSDAGGLVADPQPRLDNWVTSGGVKKTSRYRWNWYKRAGDSFLDYTNVFQWVDAANAARPEPYTMQMEAVMDTEECLRLFACEHIIVNFDAWGHEIGKNMYAFKPDGGKWQLYMFDLDWLMLAAPLHNGSYAASSAPLFNSEDPNIATMYAHPPFRRAYFRALQDAVDGPLISANCEPVMDAKYASLVANGVAYCDGQALVAPTAVKTWFSQRRGALLSQLAGVASPFTLAGPNSFTANSNLVTFSGTAPITVKSIEINGVAWPVTWTSVSNWTLRLPLAQAINVLTVLGVDLRGNPVPGASNRVTVVYSGAVTPASGAVVLNEIMYNPMLPGAEYVELFNSSTNFAFDMGGWRFNGLDYTFPEGSFIAPLNFLVLVKDRVAATGAYGTNFVAFDAYNGNLQSDGETLTLFQPGDTNTPDVIIDKVRYENSAPWPAGANGFGSSLQLIDASQDNAIPSNWSDGVGWRFFSFTGVAASSRLIIYLESAGELYIDDLSVVAGTMAGVGTNLVRNGDFESPLLASQGGPWNFIGSGATNSAIAANNRHSGAGGLHLVFTLPGPVSYIYEDMNPIVTNGTYTLSYWYLPAATNMNLTTRLSAAFRPSNPVNGGFFTPGWSNSIVFTQPAYPPLWINEVQPENLNGITDNNGQRDPWLELYNAGTNALLLDGFSLANNYTNLAQWLFPTGTTINAGEFKIIFADGDIAQSTTVEPHTSFRLSAGSGSVALSRPFGGAPQVVDYVNYQSVHPDRTYGSFPDGQPFERQEFYYVTPRAANNGASPPLVVFINEWMAANQSFLADPADNDYDDWFELYNPGTNAVDLADYYLTDTLTAAGRFKYLVTTNGPHIIPPRGYLLVWADNETGQNLSGGVPRSDLHVNFQSAAAGEALGLFAADGTQIDAVTFGTQTNNVSMGRYPDGSANIVFMSQPTPRAANLLDEPHELVLDSIGDELVHQGQTLTFTARATVHPASLTVAFSLDAGAPVGAGINANSGLFTWPTMGVFAPSTNAVIVRATDNGSPPLSDAKPVNLIVLPPPGFGAVTRSGEQLTLTWSTIPGRSYQVLFSDDLSAMNWQPQSGVLVATGSSLTFEVDLSAALHRYFKIVVAQ